MLDTIFEYLDIDDLQRMTWVSKLFCFTATLERNYDKFDKTIEPPTLPSKKDEEIDKMVTDCLNGLAKQRYHNLSDSAMQILNNNTNLKY